MILGTSGHHREMHFPEWRDHGVRGAGSLWSLALNQGGQVLDEKSITGSHQESRSREPTQKQGIHPGKTDEDLGWGPGTGTATRGAGVLLSLLCHVLT